MANLDFNEPSPGGYNPQPGGSDPAPFKIPGPSPFEVEVRRQKDYQDYLKQVQAAKEPVLTTLRKAGYSEQQVNDFAATKRGAMTAAGFSQTDIDKFLVGTSAPSATPPAWISRFAGHSSIQSVMDMGKEASVAGSTFAKDVATPSEFSQNVEKFLRSSGIWNPNSPSFAQPGSPLQTFSELQMGRFGRGLDSLAGLPGDVIDAAGKALGQAWADASNRTAAAAGQPAPFGTEEEQTAAQNYASEAANAIIANHMATNGVAGGVRGTSEVPIGGVPTTKDFVNGAKIVTGEDAPEVSNKLVTIYQDTGLHPAEVASDALIEPTVKQDLLSDNVKTPQVYLPAPASIDEDALSRLEKATGDVEDLNDQARIEAAINAIKAEPRVAGTALAIIDRTAQRLPQAQQAAIEAEVENLRRGPPKDDDEAVARIEAAASDIKAGNDTSRALAVISQASKGLTKDEKARAIIDKAVADLKALTEEGETDTSDPMAKIDLAVAELKGEGGGAGGKPPAEPPAPAAGAAEEPPKAIAGPLSKDDAVKAVLDTISIGGKKAPLKVTAANIYTSMVDRLYPLKKYMPAYQLFRLLAGVGSKADYFLHTATYDYKTLANNGAPLFTIIKDITDTGDLNEFRAYAKSVYAAELQFYGVDHGVPQDAMFKLGLDPELQARWQPHLQKLLDYNTRLMNYLKDSGVISQESFDHIQQFPAAIAQISRLIPDDYVAGAYGIPQFVKNPVKKIESADTKTVDFLESVVKNTHLFITMADRNEAATKLIDLIMGFNKGAEPGKELILPVASQPPTMGVPAVRNALAKYISSHGGPNVGPDDSLIDMLSSTLSPDPQGTVSIFRNGKRETYSVDPDIADAVHSADAKTIGLLTKIMGNWTSFYRGTYILNPDFWLRHLPRDMVYAPITYGGKGTYNPIDFAKGIISMLIRNDDFQNWVKGGGGHVSFVGMDRKYVQKDLNKLNSSTSIMSLGTNVLNTPFRVLQYLTDTTLNASHLGAFIKFQREQEALAAGRMSVSEGGKPIRVPQTRADVQNAAWVSRNTGIDTARIGAKMSVPNMILPFANPIIQDTMRVAEALSNPKTAVKSWLNLMLYVVLPSAVNWYHNKDDPHYQNEDQTKKDLQWIVPGLNYNFHIAKPFGTGVLFGSGTEHLLDLAFKHDSSWFNEFATDFRDTFAPTILPVFATPILEQYANRVWFTGDPLIPHRFADKGILPEYQYEPNTTETAKAVAMLVSKLPGITQSQVTGGLTQGVASATTSPILIENYIRQWMGGVGTAILAVTDLALKKAGVVPDLVKPSGDLFVDNPFIKGFVTRHPQDETGIISRFYDQFDSLSSLYNTLQNRIKAGDLRVMATLGGPAGVAQVTAQFKVLSNFHTIILQQNQAIQNITDNPKMTGDEKRQQIDQLYVSMITLSNTALKASAAVAQRLSK